MSRLAGKMLFTEEIYCSIDCHDNSLKFGDIKVVIAKEIVLRVYNQ